MLDLLRRTARVLSPLRLPALLVAALSGIYTGVSIFTADGASEFEMLLGFVGLLWGLSSHFFIATFSEVPERMADSQGFQERLKNRLSRGWYVLVALVFCAASLGVLVLTGKLFSLWLSR